jgi:hypothetical protein
MVNDKKCNLCVKTICCTYTTQKIPNPRAKADFDYLLWQVSHEGVEIYKDEDGWFLLIQGRCAHIQLNGQCGIYETRPQICRDYDNDFCEYDEAAEKHFDLHFKNYQQLLAYCKKRFAKW